MALPNYFELIKKICNKLKLNCNNVEYLGSGANGRAYSINNDIVIKFTMSEQEAKYANTIKNKNYPHISKIYGVFELKNHSELGTNFKYVVIMEKLKPLNINHDRFYFIESLPPSKLNQLKNLGLNSNEIKFFKQLQKLEKYNQKYNILNFDISPNNMGYKKNGTLAQFDIESHVNFDKTNNIFNINL